MPYSRHILDLNRNSVEPDAHTFIKRVLIFNRGVVMAVNTKTVSNRFSRVFHIIVTAFVLTALWAFAYASSARADFQSDITEAAKKSEVKLGDIAALSEFFGNAAAKALGNLKLKNPKAETGVLMGDATMPGLKFDVTFMLFKGKGPKDFFVGMKPKSTLKFSKFLGNVPGVKLLDVLSLGNQALFVAIADQEVASDDLPASVKNVIKPIFGTDTFTLPLKQGVTFATGVDLGKSGPIKDALSFIGAQSTTISLIGSLSPNLLDAFLEGKTPTPSVHLTGVLPAFKPQLGGKIKIPTLVTFGFNASLQAGEASVGYSGGFTIPVAGDDLQMSLNTNMTFDIKNPEPEVEVSMIMADGTPWKKPLALNG